MKIIINESGTRNNYSLNTFEKLISKHYKLFHEKYNMNSLKYIQTVICSLIIHNIDNTVIQNLLLLLRYLYVFILILKIGM